MAVSWFERAKPCIALSMEEDDASSIEEDGDSSTEEDDDLEQRRRLVDESAEVFESRVLTAIYEFVRGMPKRILERRGELILVAAYDEKIARLLDDVQQSKRKISQLNKENKRLRRIVHPSRDALDY